MSDSERQVQQQHRVEERRVPRERVRDRSRWPRSGRAGSGAAVEPPLPGPQDAGRPGGGWGRFAHQPDSSRWEPLRYSVFGARIVYRRLVPGTQGSGGARRGGAPRDRGSLRQGNQSHREELDAARRARNQVLDLQCPDSVGLPARLNSPLPKMALIGCWDIPVRFLQEGLRAVGADQRQPQLLGSGMVDLDPGLHGGDRAREAGDRRGGGGEARAVGNSQGGGRRDGEARGRELHGRESVNPRRDDSVAGIRNRLSGRSQDADHSGGRQVRASLPEKRHRSRNGGRRGRGAGKRDLRASLRRDAPEGARRRAATGSTWSWRSRRSRRG